MWPNLINIAKSATSMLQSGSHPPNTPPKYKEDLSKINFLSSKKFYVVFCSVIILTFFYILSIGVLFLTAYYPTLTPAFVTIFTETIKILAVIIASYLGVQTVLDYRMNSSNIVEYKSENISSKEEIDVNEVTVITTNTKEKDYSIDN
mgnify:CR=1 FL=1|jgi:hypothetical protein